MHFIFNKIRTKITNADIYSVLSLAKKLQFTGFKMCKIFGPKIWSCKTFDKFQVCMCPDLKLVATVATGSRVK